MRRFNTLRPISSLTTQRLPAKRQRFGSGAKILLDIAKESSDCFPFLKSALGFVNALIRHYEVLIELGGCHTQLTYISPGLQGREGKGRGTHSPVGEVQTEHCRDEERRRPSGDPAALRILQVRPSTTHYTIPVDLLPSALEEIEKRSHALLKKGGTARLVDKGEDSVEVTRLIERLREAITHYQVGENYVVASNTAHIRAGITATSHLQSNHQPHCKHLPPYLHTLC